MLLWVIINWPPAELPEEPKLNPRDKLMLSGVLLALVSAVWVLLEPVVRR